MKSFYISLILLFTVFPNSSFCSPEGGGELLVRIINPISNKINISFTANNYVWDWVSNTVVSRSGDYQEFVEKAAVSFTAPKNSSAALKIYWGYYQVSVQSLKNDGTVDFSSVFYLDLRDEGWSITGEGGYQGVDTYIRIDQTGKEVYLEADHNGYFNSVLIFGEESINRIW
ncbi:MAG: hypothetical protein MUF28_14810 [Ignavibacterium sp.]|jgi:hypothetical protein|nr:hypothetical protein [Ignavibacterium sp.]